MTDPTVSVCMASYNHAAFIRAAVESVLQQSFTDWELVITDDGSTDGTLAALDGIHDDRIRMERFPENRSACIALNNCIRRARGRFIAVLNSDDSWASVKLARQVSIMETQPRTAAVFTLAAMIDERGKPLPAGHPSHQTFRQPNRQRIEWLRRLLLQGNCLCHPSALVRSDVYREVGLYDECMAQLPDLDMWIRICCRHDIWVIQEQLTSFRLLDEERNASGNRPEVRVRCAVENMLLSLKAFRDAPGEIASVVGAANAESVPSGRRSGVGPLASMLADSGDQAVPVGVRMAQIVWMHEQLSKGGDSQSVKRFIQKTADYDPFNIRDLERLALPGSSPKRRDWWNRLSPWRG
jgi:glycosyltransferase involved in cell wall biosynthesis